MPCVSKISSFLGFQVSVVVRVTCWYIFPSAVLIFFFFLPFGLFLSAFCESFGVKQSSSNAQRATGATGSRRRA